MERLSLLHRLIYLDRDYISDAYEAITGVAAATQITKTQAKKAGAGLTVFSAEISAGETRAFSLSTTAMLKEVLGDLESLPSLPPQVIEPGKPSRVGWIEGELSVLTVRLRRSEADRPDREVDVSDRYFSVRDGALLKVALLSTPEYFVSGLAAFITLYETVIGHHGVPVRALVRAYPASSDFQEILAVPLVMIERPTAQ